MESILILKNRICIGKTVSRGFCKGTCASHRVQMEKRGKKITRMTHSKLDGFNSSQIGSIQNLNGTIGGLASAGLSYGLTGEATFNILNITDFGAGASSGLLEMTLSRNKGVTARLGTGGTDLSFGTVSTSLQGIKALNKNMQITRAAKRNNMSSAATALRTQYGFGDEKQLAQLEEILKGRTELKRGSGDGKAQTIAENGKRTVYLKNYKDGMTREEQLALGITLGHEAYRDGITGNAQSQFNETAEAVLGHTAMAKRMQSDSMYNDIMTGLINTDKNLRNDMTAFDYALATGDWGTFGSYVGDNYDYSADYWLFRQDGTIFDDGKNYFSREIIDVNGRSIAEKIEGSDFTGSRVAALVEAIGFDNVVNKMLDGKNWNNSDLYSADLLKEIGLTDSQIQRVQHSGKFNITLTNQQKNQLVGELLMAQNNASWDASARKWNTGNLAIPELENNDSLGVIRNSDTGKYTFFAAGIEFTRENDAFDIYKNGKTKLEDTTYEQRDNTDASFWIKDLFTNEKNETLFDNAFTSIDRISGTTKKIGDSEYTGNTIISEYFKMHLVNYWDSTTYGVDRVGVFTDAETLSGKFLNKHGTDGSDSERYLYHPFSGYAGSKGCIGPMSNNGIGGWNDSLKIGTGAYYFQKQLDLFDKYGIYKGYEFNIRMQGRIRP